MTRLICAVGVFLLCTAFGAVRAEGLRVRLRASELLLSDLNFIASSLRYERRTAASIAEKLSKTGKLTEFWAKLAHTMDGGASFGAAWELCAKELPLDPGVASAALSFAKNFGSGDAESELAQLELTVSGIGDAVETKAREYPNKRKLTGTLSILFGVAAALLII